MRGTKNLQWKALLIFGKAAESSPDCVHLKMFNHFLEKKYIAVDLNVITLQYHSLALLRHDQWFFIKYRKHEMFSLFWCRKLHLKAKIFFLIIMSINVLAAMRRNSIYVLLLYRKTQKSTLKNSITSESKKPGQIAVVIHYWNLSRFFLTQTLL